MRLLVTCLSFALAVFALLFAFRYAYPPNRVDGGSVESSYQFETKKQNYASSKAPSPEGQLIGDRQKFEKVATLTQQTSDFEADRAKINALIIENKAVVQFEEARGLKGRRLTNLGIGVPPDMFDAFVAAVQTIGKNARIDVVKNDKTNEYLKLRARRTTLEKARASLEALKKSGGSLDERVNVQGRLTDIEQQIQDLGVSLGEFDTQNELCTVKLTLEEERPRIAVSRRARLSDAFEWATFRTVGLGAGLFGVSIGSWLLILAGRFVIRLTSEQKAGA